MAKTYLSAARQWEANLKSGFWGFDELGLQELPEDLRQQIWMDVMFQCGSKLRPIAPATQAQDPGQWLLTGEGEKFNRGTLAS